MLWLNINSAIVTTNKADISKVNNSSQTTLINQWVSYILSVQQSLSRCLLMQLAKESLYGHGWNWTFLLKKWPKTQFESKSLCCTSHTEETGSGIFHCWQKTLERFLLELQIFGPVGCLHKCTWMKPNKKPITCLKFFFAPKLEFIITVVYYVERSSRFVGGSKVDILKVLLCANIKTTHSFIHHFPIYLSFCPYFFCFSWTRLRWRWRRTSGSLRRGCRELMRRPQWP